MPTPFRVRRTRAALITATGWFAFLSITVLVCGLTMLASRHAAAAGATSQRYDPVIGSRWEIQSEERDEKRIEATVTVTGYTNREELTVVAKTDDGFLVDFVIRDYQATGNKAEAEAANAMFGVFRDIVVHAQLDKDGKPLRVVNLDEVKAGCRTAKDRVIALFDDEKLKAKIDELLESVLIGGLQNPESAATNFLGDLTQLATVQNAGLKLGEERRFTTETTNPLGGTVLKTTSVLRLTAIDAAANELTFVETSAPDPAAWKQAAIEAATKLGVLDKVSGPDIDKVLKAMTLMIDERSEFKVKDGVTREVTQDSNFTLSAAGHTLTQREHTLVTVTPIR